MFGPRVLLLPLGRPAHAVLDVVIDDEVQLLVREAVVLIVCDVRW